MPEVQNPDRKSSDPRWITLRVSRINLGISLLGALLAFPVMLLVSGMPPWIRIALLAGFTLSMVWDLRLILLKGRHSVGAFHLLDLDPALSSPSGAKPGKRDTGKDLPRLGIRLRLANAAKHRVAAELDGVVLAGSFVSPWFTALRYRLPDDTVWRRGWPRVIPLWPDSLEAGEFRKIRVALKWK